MDYILVWNLGRKSYRLRLPGGNISSMQETSSGKKRIGLFDDSRFIPEIDDIRYVLRPEGTMDLFSDALEFDRWLNNGRHVCLDAKSDFEDFIRIEASGILNIGIRSGVIKLSAREFLREIGVHLDMRNFSLSWQGDANLTLDINDITDSQDMILTNHGLSRRISFTL